MIKISASTNPCNEDKLLEYFLQLQNMGIDYVHCDVMDGKFVTNTALPMEKVRELSYGCLLPIDVHLMVKNPVAYLESCFEAKVNYVTVQYEVFISDFDLLMTLNIIKANGLLAGLSIKPSTDINKILPLLKYINLLMIMSVEPGKSGQKFLDETFKKFEIINNYRQKNNLNFKLQADGGVNLDNVEKLKTLGVDIAVVGSALYGNKNRQEFIEKFKGQ